MSDQAIAIIGLTLRLPDATTLHQLWSNLEKGKVSVRNYHKEELLKLGVPADLLANPKYVPVASSLPDIDLFDPDFFSMSHREAELLDPQHRVLLECAWELIETIGYGNPAHRPRIGIFAGASMNTYLSNVIRSECDLTSLAGTELMLANDKDYLCARISYKLGLEGPSIVLQTGCSTSLTAVHYAAQSLLCGECDIALAGGVSVHANLRPGYLYEPDLIFSPDGMCRPFDETAAGTFFGDGAGLVALRPLRDAVAEGDTIHAVILGSATNNDGSARLGFTVPSIVGQRRLISEAQAVAGVEPGDIGMIEAHGTATVLGDPIEFTALCEAFREKTSRQGFCALGSIKANVGHLAAAAGIAGLAKTIIALKKGTVPPHPTFSRINPSLKLDESPFLINQTPIGWPVPGVRHAGVSSFGAGGSNVHMIVAEGPRKSAKKISVGWRAITLSGRDCGALTGLASRLADHIENEPDIDIDDMAFTLTEGRSIQSCKSVFYARSAGEFVRNLREKNIEISVNKVEPQRLILVLNSALPRSYLADHNAFLNELNGIIEALNEHVSIKISRDDVIRNGRTEIESNDWDMVHVIGAMAYVSTWMRTITTPIFIMTDGVTDIAAACALGMLSISEVANVMTGSRIDPAKSEQLKHKARSQLWSLRHGYIESSQAWVLPKSTKTSENYFSSNPISPKDVVFMPENQGDFSSNVRNACVATGAPLISGTYSDTQEGHSMLHHAGEMWRHGIEIDWSVFRKADTLGRIPLPVQPLRRHRCWYDASFKREGQSNFQACEGAFLAVDRSNRNFLYVERWRRIGRCTLITHAPKSGKLVALIDRHCLLSRQVISALRSQGLDIISVSRGSKTGRKGREYIFNPEEPQTYEILAQMFREDGIVPNRILLIPGEIEALQKNIAAQLQFSTYALLELAKTFSGHASLPLIIDLVGSQFADVLGGEDISPARAAAIAASHTLIQEMPNVQCRFVDIRDVDTLNPIALKALVSEILDLERPRIIALRNGWRWEQSFEQLKYVPASMDMQNLICLVVGGLGSVGYNLAKYLAVEHKAKLILLTRSPIHAGEINERRTEQLQELCDAGITFEVIVSDITDGKAVAEAIQSVELRIGAVNCFIHAAGLSGPEAIQWIQRTNRTQWQAHMQPKIVGATILHALFEGRNLKFGCFVSSLSIYAGGLGLAAYAAANQACATFAINHCLKQPYFVIDWDGWEGWKTDGSFKYSADRARPLTYDEATRAFEAAIHCRSERRIAVSTVPLAERLNSQTVSQRQVARPGTSFDSNYQIDSPLHSVQEELSAIWGEVLRCKIDAESNFFDLGGDSLVGAELVGRVNAHFGVALSMVDLFEVSTVRFMADLISCTLSTNITRGL